MLEPETLDRQLEELARVLGDLLALHRDACANKRASAMQTHAWELLSALVERSCGVNAHTVVRSLAGQDTDQAVRRDRR